MSQVVGKPGITRSSALFKEQYVVTYDSDVLIQFPDTLAYTMIARIRNSRAEMSSISSICNNRQPCLSSFHFGLEDMYRTTFAGSNSL